MQRVAGRGWAQMSPRVGEARLAQGRGSVGAGWGPGGAGERASMGAMHRRGRQLFAQAGNHCRNALLQRFDELLVHFEHLL